MWVSTKAQYGMRALVEVAMWGGEPVSLKTISQRQLISHQYLEQIFAELRRAGIVDSVRGARGGVLRDRRRGRRLDGRGDRPRHLGRSRVIYCVRGASRAERRGASSRMRAPSGLRNL